MSTENFLSFIRQGNYVSALDWPHFLISKYCANKPVDGDGLLTLAVYELIHSDLSHNDLESIQILYAFLNSFILPAEKAYAGTVIISAVMQYYVYLEKGLLEFYQNEALLNFKDIEQWMNRDNLKINAEENSGYLAEKTALFEEKLPKYNKVMEEISKKMLLISHYQAVCQEYINLLSNFSWDQKNIKTSVRLGIAQSLHDYLCQQSLYTPEIKEEIAAYVNKIRAALEPGPTFLREETYLIKLEDKTTFQRFYDHSVYCAGFFAKNVIKTMFAFNVDEDEKSEGKNNLSN